MQHPVNGFRAILASAVMLAALVVAAAPAVAVDTADPTNPSAAFPTNCPSYPADGEALTICSGDIESFDGTTIDADLTLPASGASSPDGKHPLIVMLHGFGSDKHYWESNDDTGDDGDLYHWNSHWFANKGYYVLTYTARGFDTEPAGANKPSTPADDSSRRDQTPGAADGVGGTIRLKTKDFEAKDTKWLAGLAAKQFSGIDPDRVAVTGLSYGGGESWLLASDRLWEAPAGSGFPDLTLQAAVPKYGWSDLLYSLAPHGRPNPLGGGGTDGSDGGTEDGTDGEDNEDGEDGEDKGDRGKGEGHDKKKGKGHDKHGDGGSSGGGGDGDGGDDGGDNGDGDDAPAAGQPDSIYESAASTPNDDTPVDDDQRFYPVGIPKESYIGLFFGLGQLDGSFEDGPQTYTGPCNPGAPEEPYSITTWNPRVEGGEPYEPTDPVVGSIRCGMTEYRSSYFQQDAWHEQAESGDQVAIFAIQGWTDDLFPAVETFRQFKYLKRLDRDWPIAGALGDIGHPRAQNKSGTWRFLNGQANSFLSSHIPTDESGGPTGITSEETVCGPGIGERISAATPEQLGEGTLSVNYKRDGALTNESGAGDPNGAFTDPIVAVATPGRCQLSQGPSTGYTAVSDPLDEPATMAGLGYVELDHTFAGISGQIDARIFDVPPGADANETCYGPTASGRDATNCPALVTRGTYRLLGPSDGTIRLPLFGNHWELAKGHRLRLDLVQQDSPFLKPTGLASAFSFEPPTLKLPIVGSSSQEVKGQ